MYLVNNIILGFYFISRRNLKGNKDHEDIAAGWFATLVVINAATTMVFISNFFRFTQGTYYDFDPGFSIAIAVVVGCAASFYSGHILSGFSKGKFNLNSSQEKKTTTYSWSFLVFSITLLGVAFFISALLAA
jgi:hypothetical protein